MAPAYFGGHSWDSITREERVFCAELVFHIRKDPQAFVKLLQEESSLPSVPPGPWDVAYEACFYRDFLHRFAPAEKSKFSTKRTFDIALFSDHAIIVVEAKVAEPFKADQARYFLRDKKDIRRLLKSEIDVFFVALASGTYFENYRRIGRGTALEPFEGRHLTWEAVERRYPGVPLLKRACEVYERSLLSIVDADAVPPWQASPDRAAQIAVLKEEIAQRERVIEDLERDGSA